jgi:predicted lipid-binding transport protein (Tim44 family)
MKKHVLLFVFCMTLCFHAGTVLAEGSSVQNPPTSDPAIQNRDDNPINAESYSSGRGSYRSPGGSFSGGNRGGISPGYRTGPRAPSSDVSRRQPNAGQPGSPFGRWGGFLGGAAAGALIAHLLNPFAGFGNGGGFSFLGLLFWVLILYLGYKLFQRFRRRNR